MIDSNFITDYTTALYSAPAESLPSYNEFRDMFSTGQIKSKQWAIDQLSVIVDRIDSAIIVGAWYGTLGMMLTRMYPTAEICLLDIDARCKQFTDCVFSQNSHVRSVTADMYDYEYTESLIINTSCEHIVDLEQWIKLLRPGSRVLLQSNNCTTMDGHINCSQSVNEFIEKTKLTKIEYAGELVMPMYTRFMIIGQV